MEYNLNYAILNAQNFSPIEIGHSMDGDHVGIPAQNLHLQNSPNTCTCRGNYWAQIERRYQNANGAVSSGNISETNDNCHGL